MLVVSAMLGGASVGSACRAPSTAVAPDPTTFVNPPDDDSLQPTQSPSAADPAARGLVLHRRTFPLRVDALFASWPAPAPDGAIEVEHAAVDLSPDLRYLALAIAGSGPTHPHCAVFVFDLDALDGRIRSVPSCAQKLSLASGGSRLATYQDRTLNDFEFDMIFGLWNPDTIVPLAEHSSHRRYARVQLESMVLGGDDPGWGRGRLVPLRVRGRDLDQNKSVAWEVGLSEIQLLANDRILIGAATQAVSFALAGGPSSSYDDALSFGHGKGRHAIGDACAVALDPVTGELRTYDVVPPSLRHRAVLPTSRQGSDWSTILTSSDCTFVVLPRADGRVFRTRDGRFVHRIGSASSDVRLLRTLYAVEQADMVTFRSLEDGTEVSSAPRSAADPSIEQTWVWAEATGDTSPRVRGVEVHIEPAITPSGGLSIWIWEATPFRSG